MERRIDVCAGRIFAFALVALFLLTAASVAQPNVQGHWTTLSYSMPINPVHVALLHTGKILVVSGSGNVAGNTNYYLGSSGQHHQHSTGGLGHVL